MKTSAMFLVAVVFAAGCVNTNEQMKNEGAKNAMMENYTMMNDTMAKSYSGKILAGTTAPVIDFNKADYDAALKSDKVVLLYFYATWCPICRAEIPHLYGAFNELNTDKIIAFRVNYNDGDTDNDERALAQQFQVPYQHTKVFIRNGKLISKHPDSWDKARYLSEINKVIV